MVEGGLEQDGSEHDEGERVEDGPALLDVVTNRMELSMPPTITLDQAVGFNLWALKSVLSGRGSELVDLTVTNVFR